MTSNRNFSRPVKRSAYARANGCCESCGVYLPAGFGGIEYHHIDPWTISHDSSLGNCRLLCVPCHKEITGSHDRPVIDKNRRLRDTAIGIKRAGKKLPGGRDSGIKKKINGEVVARKERGHEHRELMARRYGGEA
jgi:hypothetical protein